MWGSWDGRQRKLTPSSCLICRACSSSADSMPSMLTRSSRLGGTQWLSAEWIHACPSSRLASLHLQLSGQEARGILPRGDTLKWSEDPFSSVQSLSAVWFCDPTDYSRPGFPIHHQLPELAQTHVHQVGDATQPSHPLSSPSLPALNLSQHQSLF